MNRAGAWRAIWAFAGSKNFSVFVMVMALARGLENTFTTSGDPRNLLVIRKGSTSESSSQIGRSRRSATVRLTTGSP